MQTDEERGTYVVGASEMEDSTNNAMAVLGEGYDQQKAAIIERPRKVHGIGDDGLEEYQLFGWVKMSAKFRSHIKKLRGAKLGIWLCVALSIDENGECKLKIKELEKITGYSHTEIIDSVQELDELGFLSVNRNGKTNMYQPVFVAKGTGKTPRVKKLDSTPLDSNESSPSLEKFRPTSSKKELRIKNSAEKPAKPPTPPEILIYREVTSLYPPKETWESVVGIIQSVSKRLGRETTADDLRPFLVEWLLRGWKKTNINWTSWAVTGIIPPQYKPYQKPSSNFDNNMSILQAFAEKGS